MGFDLLQALHLGQRLGLGRFVILDGLGLLILGPFQRTSFVGEFLAERVVLVERGLRGVAHDLDEHVGLRLRRRTVQPTEQRDASSATTDEALHRHFFHTGLQRPGAGLEVGQFDLGVGHLDGERVEGRLGGEGGVGGGIGAVPRGLDLGGGLLGGGIGRVGRCGQTGGRQAHHQSHGEGRRGDQGTESPGSRTGGVGAGDHDGSRVPDISFLLRSTLRPCSRTAKRL